MNHVIFCGKYAKKKHSILRNFRYNLMHMEVWLA